MMNIDDSCAKTRAELRAKHPHIFCQDEKIWAIVVNHREQVGLLRLGGSASTRNVMKRNIKFFHEPGEVRMIGNHSEHASVELVKGMPDENVGQAMVLFGCKHDDTFWKQPCKTT